MWTIAIREFRSFFLSPLAWSILGVIQLIFGWVFAILLYWYLQPDIQSQLANHPEAPGLTDIVVRNLFEWIGIVLLLIVPLITMRLISEERRNRTLPLLLASPVSMTSIILGKYLGVMGFFFVMLAMLMLMPLSLLLGGTLDFGQVGAGLLGVILLIGAFTAIGLYISTLTAHPTVAAIGTFGMLLMLWMVNWADQAEEQTGILTYLSITEHYHTLLKGVFNSQDVVYYVLVIVLFLALSVQRLEGDRI